MNYVKSSWKWNKIAYAIIQSDRLFEQVECYILLRIVSKYDENFIFKTFFFNEMMLLSVKQRLSSILPQKKQEVQE